MDPQIQELFTRAEDWQIAAGEVERIALNSLSLEQVRMAITNVSWGFRDRVKQLKARAEERQQELEAAIRASKQERKPR